MAEDCADDDDAKEGISDLRKSALEELKMHNSIVEVSLEASCPIDFQGYLFDFSCLKLDFCTVYLEFGAK